MSIRIPVRYESVWEMDDPKPGFIDNFFTTDNWNDPTLNFIRNGFDAENSRSLFYAGKSIPHVLVGNDDALEETRFHCSAIATGLGQGLVYASIFNDYRYAVVYSKKKDQWFYVAWYKERGRMEALHYAEEVKGVFSLKKNPVSYVDAIFLGHLLNSIESITPAKKAKITQVHTHELN